MVKKGPSLGEEAVAKKQGKLGFFGCLVSVFSISSPHGHLSSSKTLLLENVSFILAFLLLLLCFLSLRWLCFLVSIHIYFYSVLYFSFSSLSLHAVFSLHVTTTQIKSQNL